jgi:hypothetical protein
MAESLSHNAEGKVVLKPAGWRGYWKAILAFAVPLVYAAVEAALIAFGDGEWTNADTKYVILGVGAAALVLLKGNKTVPATTVKGEV